MDHCYYSLIRFGLDGRIFAWIPDLPGVISEGADEQSVISELTRRAKACLHRIEAKGIPVPAPRPTEDFPRGDFQGRYRRLLLVL